MDAVAVIGMAVRVPGARDLQEFWRNLADGRDTIARYSDDELRAAGVAADLLKDPHYVRAGGALDDVECFDAGFFGVSPREADLMDPQQRWFLETAWEALEHACVVPSASGARIAVYAGSSPPTWVSSFGDAATAGVERVGRFQTAISNERDFLATRVSYALGLTGPSITVQSACSTSLVAICQAWQALLTFQTDCALAGGVAIRFPHRQGYLYEKGMIYSPHGRCRPFDVGADGCVAGNGVGVVVLKRLAEARADGETVHAVILGAAVNNDGSAKVSFTAPGVRGQSSVIADALQAASVEPDTIALIEAHGTATPLGDAMELAALREVFGLRPTRRQYCALGSVKSNVGHLDAAAGVVGLIKAVLAIEHGQIPPTANFERANPALDIDAGPFFVADRLLPWNDTPRRAGVSSFGIGGTNAHVVLEQVAERPVSDATRYPQLLALSARTVSALDAATDRLAEHLIANSGDPTVLADTAYTLQTGRARFPHRRTIVCEDIREAIDALQSADSPRSRTDTASAAPPRIAFLFPGGGAQHPAMGAGLYEAFPVYRQTVDECAERLRPLIGTDLRTIVFGREAQHAAMLQRPLVGFVALFATEMAAARLLAALGVAPVALLGHSVGEYAAACVAGVMTLADALALVALRGTLFERLPPGAMLSVALPEDEVRRRLPQELSIAALNGPEQCVVSGPRAVVDRFGAELTAENCRCRAIPIEVSGHSSMVDPILDAFADGVSRLKLAAPSLPLLSNVTGDWIQGDASSAGYWRQHLRMTVRFGECLDRVADAAEVLLEVGPGTTITSLTKGRAIPLMRHPLESQSDVLQWLSGVGRLWMAGHEVDWAALHAPARRRRIALPSYPFERHRHTLAEATSIASGSRNAERFFLPAWLPSPPPRIGAAGPSTALLFARDESLDAALERSLRDRGVETITVVPGDGFAQIGPRRFSVRPGSRRDYDRLLEVASPSLVLHCWTTATHVAAFDDETEVGYHSLVALSAALARRPGRPLRVEVLSRGVYDVGGSGSWRVRSLLLGPCRVMPYELPHVRCRHADLALVAADPSSEADRVVTELLAPSSDAVVAWRGATRFVPRFERVPLEDGDTPFLRDDGVYLITGAFGQIGLFLSTAFAEHVRCRLVLVARHGPSGRDEQAALNRIRALGSVASVEVVDVSDRVRLSEVVARTVRVHGNIDGVIHAAGVTHGPSVLTPMEQLGREAAVAQFAAKVHGVEALAAALQPCRPAFVVLLSSNASTLGGTALAAYAAANAYMDAFAADRARESSVPWISASWDGWRVGAYASASAARTSIDDFALGPDECLDALQRIVTSGLRGHVVISKSDFARRLLHALQHETTERTGRRAIDPAPRAPVRSAHEPARTSVERGVTAIWEDLLGVHPIGRDESFFELGGHSLVGLRVIQRIRAEFQVDVPLRSLFEAPTVAGLARRITDAPDGPAGGSLASPDGSVGIGDADAR